MSSLIIWIIGKSATKDERNMDMKTEKKRKQRNLQTNQRKNKDVCVRPESCKFVYPETAWFWSVADSLLGPAAMKAHNEALGKALGVTAVTNPTDILATTSVTR